jgi:hypothetical protein
MKNMVMISATKSTDPTATNSKAMAEVINEPFIGSFPFSEPFDNHLFKPSDGKI